MQIIEINPRDCTRWKYADRSHFEFGNTGSLSEDIKENGQVEPVIVRPLLNSEYKYEIIAGSRRFQACFNAGLMLKAVIRDVSDEEAAIIQIKENEHISICDYSKGIYYAKLMKDKKITQDKLSQVIGCSRHKLNSYLCFAKVSDTIWKAVGNTSKVSAKTAETMYAFEKNGKAYVDALIDLDEEIRKGTGTHRLTRMVNAIIVGEDSEIIEDGVIKLPSGAIIGTWKNNNLKLAKHLNIDQDKFIKHLIKFF
jgi:ParB family chromosome partitioning protein